jgi:hypothetical protein
MLADRSAACRADAQTIQGEPDMKPHHTAATTRTKARPAKAKAAASTPAAAENTTAAPASPGREEFIREAAYYHFEARGGVGGHELEDWLRAEAEFERLHRDGTSKAAVEPGAH